jgi:hypothetical protein
MRDEQETERKIIEGEGRANKHRFLKPSNPILGAAVATMTTASCLTTVDPTALSGSDTT